MFIAKDYDLQLEAPACEPGAEYWNATAVFSEEISEVFPYLNAMQSDVIYSCSYFHQHVGVLLALS